MRNQHTSSTIKSNLWILVVIGIFAVAYACSLTFVYIDPADALSVEYHTLGRNDGIQPPFERFQMGMDALLALLPQDESIVRVTAMATTALAEVALVLLVLLLAIDFMGPLTAGQKAGLALALPIAAPELIYIGLLYTPMLVGMCCAVGSHLVFRRTLKRTSLPANQISPGKKGLIVSALLMGLAGLFRWDVLAYGVVVLVDVLVDPQENFGKGSTSLYARMRILLLWGMIALAVWLAIEIFALDFAKAFPEAIEAARGTKGEMTTRDPRIIISHAMFFSPAFLLAALTGWVVIVRKKSPMRWFVLALTLLAAVWPFWSTPKEVLVLVPFFVILFALGVTRIWEGVASKKWSAVWRTSLVILLLLPWLVGIQVAFGDKSWGPGFELRPFSHPVGTGIHDVRLVLGAGAAFPSNEGVRPLFGHAAVLLGGKWRAMAEGNAAEIDRVIDIAREQSMPILTFEGYDAYLMNSAIRAGFSTKDPKLDPNAKERYVRRLTDTSGKTLVLIGLPINTSDLDSASIVWTIAQSGSGRVVCWSEPGRMRELYRSAPPALEELGPRSAILDLDEILAGLRERANNEEHL